MRLRILILACLLVCGAAAFADDTPASGGKVTIPLAEFLKLTKPGPGASPAQRPQAPVGYALSQGDYRVAVQGDWARVEASITLQVLNTGWQEIPLLPQDVVVQEARLDGQPLSLYPKDDVYTFMVRGAGRRQLTLVYHLPVQDKAPSRSVALRTPETAASTLRIVVPGGKVRITATPDVPLSTRSDGDRTVAWGALPAEAEEPVSLSWLPLQADARLHGQASQEKPRIYGRLYQLVTVSEKAIQCRARIDCSILRNEVSGFRVALPAGAEVLAVTCPNLAAWRTEDRTGGRLLLVSLGQPVSGDQTLEITTEKTVQDIDSRWPLPFVYLEGAERVKGSIGVCSTGGIELLPKAEPQEARRIDVQEDLPAQVQAMATSPVLLAYEYSRQPYQVELESKKGKEVAVLDATIDSGAGRTLVTEEGKAVSIFTWQVRNNSRQSILMALPEGAEVWSAFVDGRPAKPILESDGRVRLPLVVSQGSGGEMGTFPVTHTYALGPKDLGGNGLVGQATYLAPRVDIPISELTWELYLPADRQVLRLGGTMEPPQASGRRSAWSPLSLGRGAQAPTRDGKEAAGEPPAAPAPGSPNNMLQTRTRGVFPVQVFVPRVGQSLMFTRLMVSGDEAPSIMVTSASSSMAVAFGWMVFGLALMLGATRLLGSAGWKGLAGCWVGLLALEVLLGDTWLSGALTGLGRALTLLTLLWLLMRVRGAFALAGSRWSAWRARAAGEAAPDMDVPPESPAEEGGTPAAPAETATDEPRPADD